MSMSTLPVRSPWPLVQGRLDATGLKGCKAVKTDHGWGSVILPNGKSVVILHGSGGHDGLWTRQPEEVVLAVLWAVATHDENAPLYDVDGNALKAGTIPGQWHPWVCKDDGVLMAEQWRTVDHNNRPSDREYREAPPRKVVKVDTQRLLDYINEDPTRVRI